MNAQIKTATRLIKIFFGLFLALYIFNSFGLLHEMTSVLIIALFIFVFWRILRSKDSESESPGAEWSPVVEGGRDDAPASWSVDLRVLLNAQGDVETLRDFSARLKGRFLARQIEDLADLVERLIQTIRKRRAMLPRVRRLLAHDVAALAHRFEKEFATEDEATRDAREEMLGDQVAALAGRITAILAGSQAGDAQTD